MALIDTIRNRAYEIWEARGCPEGDAVAEEIWLEAETEIDTQRLNYESRNQALIDIGRQPEEIPDSLLS